MPRYTFRRLSKLPLNEEGLRRYVELNAPDALPGVAVRRTVMRPGAEFPVAPEDVSRLFVTVLGRGVMLLDGDRIEVSATEVVFVPAGCPCGLQTLGGTDWVYLVRATDVRGAYPGATAHWLAPISTASASASESSTRPRFASLIVR